MMESLLRTGLMLFILIVATVSASSYHDANAQDQDQHDASLLNNLRKMRKKQQAEEGHIRINKFVRVETEEHCTPVQQTRQRIKDLVDELDDTEGDVNITAGHEEINIQDNHGTIDSEINVQIINNGEERKCL